MLEDPFESNSNLKLVQITVPKITCFLKVSAPKGNVIVKEGDAVDLLCKPNVYIAFCDFTNERTTFNYKLDYWRNVHQGEYAGMSITTGDDEKRDNS